MKWWEQVPPAQPKSAPAIAGGYPAGHWRQDLWHRGLRRIYAETRKRFGTPLLRARLAIGVEPLSDRWFARGQPVHRYYTERFLSDNAEDIRGRCLEFQEDSYTSRFGGARVARVDVLHKERDARAGRATLFADLTRENSLPSAAYDCIVCTYVLHVVDELAVFVGELHRLLRPGGVLLVVVPNITVAYAEFPELWRFTPLGLTRLLERSFGAGNVQARSYGNSLTCAGEIRGLAVTDFAAAELDDNDPRYGLVACARAVKGRVD